jgi:biopolymer transport protein ExbD
MSISFSCPSCGRKFNVDARLAGRKAPCAGCGVELTIPDDAPAESQIEEIAAESESRSSSILAIPGHKKHPEDLIDMTAMVDIVFFLLIFFMVTSLQSLESVMDMPTPEADESSQAQPKQMSDYENDADVVMIRIEDDDSLWVDEEQAYSEQELRNKLREKRRKGSGPHSAMIVGDADASHAAAVLVFDACADVGIETVNFTVQEKTD